jgi:deazaflavin-dependent oxidoreductase (nitroreductase family)
MPRTPRPPSGLRRMMFRVPILVFRARLGWVFGHRLVLVNHRGRKTGRPRQVVVEVAARDRTTGAVTVASGYGSHSDWFRNLLVAPETTIEVGVRRLDVRAVPLSPEEGGEVMVDYARRHRLSATVLASYLRYDVDGGSADGYRALGHEIPFVRFEPMPARAGGMSGDRIG